MNSCLYKCKIMHHRLRPKEHKFTNNIFMFYLDLDEIDDLAKNIKFISRNRFNIYSFRDSEHLDYSGADVKENIINYIRSKGVSQPVKRVMLLTNLSTFGYNFNPVSFYFIFSNTDKPICAVVEISNTFRELKPFFISGDNGCNTEFKDEQSKYFYISPFIDLDVPMEFKIQVPKENLNIRINDSQDGQKLILTSMMGKKKELNHRSLLWYSLCFPLITLRVISLIHFHAMVLYFKRIPYHMKEDNPHLQREVNRVLR